MAKAKKTKPRDRLVRWSLISRCIQAKSQSRRATSQIGSISHGAIWSLLCRHSFAKAFFRECVPTSWNKPSAEAVYL
jgi:hypothetical protein